MFLKRLPSICLAAVLLTTVSFGQLSNELTVRGSGLAKLQIAGFAGSSGSSASALVGSGVTASDSVAVVGADSEAHRLQGSSSGNRIQATLNAPDGAVVFNRNYGGPDLRRNAYALADDVVRAITGVPGIASSEIAFVARVAGRKEIFLCQYDGSNVRQLTRDRVISVAPSLSEDRSRIVYTGYQSGYPDIYSIDMRTGRRTRIINSPGTNGGAAFNPAGDRIALTMSFSGNTELYVAGAGGGSARALTRTQSTEASPAWSPDGREIVYSANPSGSPQLYRISSGGGGPRLIKTGFGYATEPDWSPDGTKIAFCAQRGGMKVAVYNVSTGATSLLRAGEDPSWGPDSRHLVMASGGAMYRVDTVTGTAKRLVPSLGGISEPSWSR